MVEALKLPKRVFSLSRGIPRRATKPSADGVPARRPSCVSDLCASTQRRLRVCSLPLCGELEERGGARDIPEGREAEGKKKTSKTF